MKAYFWNPQRIAGGSIILGILITAGGFIAVAAQGNIGGLEAAFKGVEDIGGAASAFRTIGVFTPALVLLLVGFAALTAHLATAGDRVISLVALNLLVVYFVLSVIEGTFHSEVTAWASREWTRTGSVPEFYEPLRQWVNGSIQVLYMTVGFASMIAYGWALLRTRILPSWVGWTTVAYSTVWLIVVLVTQDSVPAVFLVPPLLIGVTPLVYRLNPGLAGTIGNGW